MTYPAETRLGKKFKLIILACLNKLLDVTCILNFPMCSEYSPINNPFAILKLSADSSVLKINNRIQKDMMMNGIDL